MSTEVIEAEICLIFHLIVKCKIVQLRPIFQGNCTTTYFPLIRTIVHLLPVPQDNCTTSFNLLGIIVLLIPTYQNNCAFDSRPFGQLGILLPINLDNCASRFPSIRPIAHLASHQLCQLCISTIEHLTFHQFRQLPSRFQSIRTIAHLASQQLEQLRISLPINQDNCASAFPS